MESNPVLRESIMDSITTCENSWFRDSFPFYLFKEKLLPAIAMAQPQRVRVWSAGCFVGEEPYLLSMAAEEYSQGRPGSLPSGAVTILGTDISSRSIEKAVSGLYENIAVSRGLPMEKKQKYFQQVDGKWQIIDSIRSRVKFAEQDLLQEFKLPGLFDVIFCRNVLTYFASDIKRDILSRMTKTLVPGGYVVLGKTETIENYSDQFEQIQWRDGVFYRLKS
jgi:chemotaxis protein methyltransferase CheR